MFLAGHTVVIVTYCVTKMITTSVLTNDWAFFDTMIVASSDKEFTAQKGAVTQNTVTSLKFYEETSWQPREVSYISFFVF